MDDQTLSELSVIIPNLHWRYSGVTATNRAVAPVIGRHLPAAWLGSHAPHDVARLTFGDLLRLRMGRLRSRARIWHARRNDEMIAGLLLKVLGWPFKLVFTSAGQRRHTWITRFLIEHMDAVIATSEASASYLQRAATVVLHGVDADVYRSPTDRAMAFAESGLPGKYGIGCFGRVREQKGTDLFVEAMCTLLPKYPDYCAVIIGSRTPDQRSFMRGLEERVAAAGLSNRIRFFGELPIEDVPRWYQRISIYAFTSRIEGFGLTLLEAMAAGVALVASRAGGAEQVVTDGETGILVPPGDVRALIDALDSLMRDPERAAEMGQKARRRVIADFSLEAEVARIVDVYRQTLEATHQ